MPSLGLGVSEFRVREDGGAFRVIYVGRFAEGLRAHAFQKKAQKTPKQDIDLPGGASGNWYRRESSDDQEIEDSGRQGRPSRK